MKNRWKSIPHYSRLVAGGEGTEPVTFHLKPAVSSASWLLRLWGWLGSDGEGMVVQAGPVWGWLASVVVVYVVKLVSHVTYGD
ncbi:unnamed protein product [Prunus armeniaca]